MHKKYTGFYLGYVIQNNDPDRGGKVKIYIPALMPVFAEEASTINEEGADVKVDFKDFSTLPPSMVKKIKNILPWARQMSPLIGPGNSTTYNAKNHLTTTVDDNFYRTEFAQKLKDGEQPEASPKMPGSLLQEKEFILSGGHVESEVIDNVPATPVTDPDNNSLVPELYSNQSKGMFSIPSVGAVVWVFFENGEWDLPVYFGYHYSASSWQGVYGANDDSSRGLDYPNGYENKTDNDDYLFRERTVYNHRAGALSFIGTDHIQRVNLSHRNGSFFQFDNSGYKQLIKGKGSSLVTEDYFATVQGDLNARVNRNINIICDQNITIKSGAPQYKVYSDAKNILKERADILSKFKTERTRGNSSNSTLGMHNANLDEVRRQLNPNIYTSSGGRKTAPIIKSVKTLTPKEVKERSNNTDKGLTIPPETSTYSNISSLGIKEKVGLSSGEYNGPIENKPAWVTDDIYKNNANRVGWDGRGSVSKSPSTAGGSFDKTEGTSAAEIKDKLVEINNKLNNVLKNAKDGGDQITEITKDVYIRVGAVTNDFPAVRVDPIGGIVFAGVVQGNNGASSIYKQTNLVEYTGNDSNFPCGNYTISCGNKFGADAGSGGIVLRTTGVAEIAGITTKVTGTHLIELTTAGNLSLNAGKSLTITADILSLRQSKSKQIALGGSVGVENNITIGGSAIINGELYLQHVTAPAEIQTTDQTRQIRGWTRAVDTIGTIPEGRVVAKLTKQDCEDIVQVALGYSDDSKNNGGLSDRGEDFVRVKAWNPNGVAYGIIPQYEYNADIDEYVEKDGTGFRNGTRELPETVSEENEDVPIDGTNRVTSIELEVHAHQFKNLPLSLRSTNQDVIAEARDIENYPEVRGIAKGSRPAKILVKKYGESKRHSRLRAYSASEQRKVVTTIARQSETLGTGTGNQDDGR